MEKVTEIIKERIAKGDLPLAYDLYNKTDLNLLMCALNTRSWNYGRAGAPVIFETEEDDDESQNRGSRIPLPLKAPGGANRVGRRACPNRHGEPWTCDRYSGYGGRRR